MPTPTPIRDTAYASLGLYVQAIRQANATAERVQSRLNGRFEQLTEQGDTVRTRIEEIVTPIAERLNEQFERFLSRLPEPTQENYRDAVKLGRKVVDDFQAFTQTVRDEQSTTKPAAAKKTTKVTEAA